jgi:hypothetical protein
MYVFVLSNAFTQATFYFDWITVSREGKNDDKPATYHFSDHDQLGAELLVDREDVEDAEEECDEVECENDASGVQTLRVTQAYEA